MINLWNPGHLSIAMALITAFLLGMVHGITPDEHTWPITFSYSVGSYSSKGGRKVGLLFSAAFALQRAIAAELAFVALASFEFATRWQYEVYVVVGTVMLGSGIYILKRGKSIHLTDKLHKKNHGDSIPMTMPLIHGFIAGWGIGAFAIIVYTVLVPTMPNVWVGWVPGALFGLGTMVTQVLFGLVVGAWMQKRHLGQKALEYVAKKTAGRILSGGGIGFILSGIVGIVIPSLIAKATITTSIKVHNLHHIGIGFILAVVVLFGVATWAFTKSIKEAKSMSELEHFLN